MNSKAALLICLYLAAFMALVVLFVFLPQGWNLLPLVCLALLAGMAFFNTGTSRNGVLQDTETGSASPIAPDLEPVERKKIAHRMNRAFGPVIAGLIIDLVDFATFGPVGLLLGLPVGGAAGYWMGRSLGLSRKASIGCGLAAGVYSTVPLTEFLPLGTIVGAVIRFMKQDKVQDKTNPIDDRCNPD